MRKVRILCYCFPTISHIHLRRPTALKTGHFAKREPLESFPLFKKSQQNSLEFYNYQNGNKRYLGFFLYPIKLHLEYSDVVALRCAIFKPERFWYSLRWRKWPVFKVVRLSYSTPTRGGCVILVPIGQCMLPPSTHEDYSAPLDTFSSH